MKTLFFLFCLFALTLPASAQGVLGEQTTNDTIDWRAGDMIQLHFDAAAPTVVIKNFRNSRLKTMRVTTSIALRSITWPTRYLWVNDDSRAQDLVPGDTAYYLTFSMSNRIVAIWLSKLSGSSGAPYPPTNFDVSATDSAGVTLTWNSPNGNGSAVTKYQLRRSTSPIGGTQLVSNNSFQSPNVTGWRALHTSGLHSLEYTGGVGKYDAIGGGLRFIDKELGAGYDGVLFSVANTQSGTCRYSGWIYIPSPTAATAIVDYYLLNEVNTVIGSFHSTTISTNTWTRLSATATLSGVQDSIQLGFQFNPEEIQTPIDLPDTMYVDSVSVIVGVDFASATRVTSMDTLSIGAVGAAKSYRVGGLLPSTRYYFALLDSNAAGFASSIVTTDSTTLAGTTTTTPAGPSEYVVVDTVITGYWFNATGDNSNGHSPATAFTSMTTARNYLKNNLAEFAAGYDTLLVVPGTYAQSISWSQLEFGTFAKDFVIKRKGNSGQVVFAGAGGTVQYTMHLDDCKYLLFDGITFSPSNWTLRMNVDAEPTGKYTVTIERGCDYISLKYCQVWTPGANFTGMGEEWFSPSGEWTRGWVDVTVGYEQGKRMWVRGILAGATHFTMYRSSLRGFDYGVVLEAYKPRYAAFVCDTMDHTYSSQLIIGGTVGDASTEEWQRVLVDSCIFGLSWAEDNIQFEQDYGPHNFATSRYNAGVTIKASTFADAIENAIDHKGTSYVIYDRCKFTRTGGVNGGKYESFETVEGGYGMAMEWDATYSYHYPQIGNGPGGTWSRSGTTGGNWCDYSSGADPSSYNSTYNHSGGVTIESGTGTPYDGKDPKTLKGAHTHHITLRRSALWNTCTGMPECYGMLSAHNLFTNITYSWRGTGQTICPMRAMAGTYTIVGGDEKFLNNIIIANPSLYNPAGNDFHGTYSPGGAFGMLHFISSGVITSDYNMFYDSLGVEGDGEFWYSGAGTHAHGFTAWKAQGFDANSQWVSPDFTSFPHRAVGDWDPAWDLTPLGGSDAIDAGTWLTTTTSSGSNVTSVNVGNAQWFYWDWDTEEQIQRVSPNYIFRRDSIYIAGPGAVAIESVDYLGNSITLTAINSYSNGVNIALWPMYGSAPDVGVVEKYQP